MYVRAACFECMNVKGITTAAVFDALISTQTGSLIVCPEGHRQFVLIKDGGYALLFERALQNVASGVTRDAVLDAYTAFDMFLSHVPARARYDREKGASPARLREELREATKTSERAIGAALSTLALISSASPPKIPGDLQKLRNEAVHQGKYPTQAEAEWVCTRIEKLVLGFESSLSAGGCINTQSYALASFLEECSNVDDQGAPRTTASYLCVLDRTITGGRATFLAADRIGEYRTGPPRIL